jgi:hypothetical protein
MTTNAIPWAMQNVLGVKRLSAADTRGLRPDQTKMQRAVVYPIDWTL